MLEKIKKIVHGKRFSAEIKLVSTGTLLVIVFLAFFNINGTLGWFGSNNEVTANGMNVSVKDLKDFKITLNSFAVSDIQGSAYTASTDISHALPTYDEEGIIYSPYEMALVVVVELYSHLDTTASMHLDTENLTVIYEADNYFSNCMKITPAALTGSGTDTDPYVATIDGSTQSFVSLDGGISKTDRIDLVDGLHLNADEHVTLCFVIEYDIEVLQAIINGTDSTVHELNFVNDVEFVAEHME